MDRTLVERLSHPLNERSEVPEDLKLFRPAASQEFYKSLGICGSDANRVLS
ncbi:MAG TPA: hypothetical protein V6C84_26150 [Coleofasciculaceae cyanobacterium]